MLFAGCNDYFGKSLFFMGEFGGNDYSYILAANRTVNQTASYVPTVVETIGNGVEVQDLCSGSSDEKHKGLVFGSS